MNALRPLVLLGLAFSLAACAAQPGPAPTPTATAALKAAAAPSPTPVVETRPDLESYFQGFDGAFVMTELNASRRVVYDPERCAERLLPASTFKIVNSLVALETGAIDGPEAVIAWDGTTYPYDEWHQDHNLRTAIRFSVIWYYQELARRVGAEQMQASIDAIGYGNRDISGEIDTFWLEGGLRISADEQVAMLERLYRNQLPFSAANQETVKEIMVLEQTAAYTLHGKTGSVMRVRPYAGWFVGYLEIDQNAYFFALNIRETPGIAPIAAEGVKAKEIALDVLEALLGYR